MSDFSVQDLLGIFDNDDGSNVLTNSEFGDPRNNYINPTEEFLGRNHKNESRLEDEIDTADFLGGAEIYANPKESEKAIRKAIKNHKEK